MNPSRTSESGRPVRVVLELALSLLFLAGFAGPAAAGGSEGVIVLASSASVSQAGGAEAKLKASLKRQFRIPEDAKIVFGPAVPAGIANLAVRSVVVTDPQGHQARFQLFTDANGSKAIVGQIVDLRATRPAPVDLSELHLSGRPVLGPADAPVTIIEFADFECPFCAQAFGQMETLLRTKYRGRVRLIYKNFPLSMHPWAFAAAVAADCVRGQNPALFWDFARDLYHDQPDITPKNLAEHVDRYAARLGLDREALRACVGGKAAETLVEQDRRDGEAVRVNATPTFLVDGIPVAGAPASAAFQSVLDSELRRQAASR